MPVQTEVNGELTLLPATPVLRRRLMARVRVNVLSVVRLIITRRTSAGLIKGFCKNKDGEQCEFLEQAEELRLHLFYKLLKSS